VINRQYVTVELSYFYDEIRMGLEAVVLEMLLL